MMLRGKKKTNRDVSLYEPIGVDLEGNKIQIYDILEAPDTDVHELTILNTDTELLYQVLNEQLNDRERKILILRYGLYNGPILTQKAVAKELGISRSYVSRIEKRAIEKLRPCFS